MLHRVALPPRLLPRSCPSLSLTVRIQLQVICTSKDGDQFWRMPETYIRGNTIKYLRVPDEVIDKVKDESFRREGALLSPPYPGSPAESPHEPSRISAGVTHTSCAASPSAIRIAVTGSELASYPVTWLWVHAAGPLTQPCNRSDVLHLQGNTATMITSSVM